MGKQRVVGIILLIASLTALGGLAALLPEQGGLAIDDYAERLAASLTSDPMTAAARVMAYAGSTVGVIGISLLSGLFMAIKAGWRSGVIIVAGVGAAYGINVLLKSLFDRARPELAWGIEVSGASFPSAHATLGCAMFGLIALMLIRSTSFRKPGRIIIGAVAIMLILLMGASRIYFHVHYLTDILAGYATGLAVIAVTLLLIKPLEKRVSTINRIRVSPQHFQGSK
jgi:undecaprenyl-diphosphatase